MYIKQSIPYFVLLNTVNMLNIKLPQFMECLWNVFRCVIYLLTISWWRQIFLQLRLKLRLYFSSHLIHFWRFFCVYEKNRFFFLLLLLLFGVAFFITVFRPSQSQFSLESILYKTFRLKKTNLTLIFLTMCYMYLEYVIMVNWRNATSRNVKLIQSFSRLN